jgi:hypothetical protein
MTRICRFEKDMDLAPGKGIERKRNGLIRFLKNYRKGQKMGFFRRMNEVCSCGVFNSFVVFKGGIYIYI